MKGINVEQNKSKEVKSQEPKKVKEKKFTPVYFAGPMNGIVWDKENNKPLCRFKGGRYRAKNAREVKLLRAWLAEKDRELVEKEKRAREIESKSSEEQVWAQNNS